jgi:hypothetical protein
MSDRASRIRVRVAMVARGVRRERHVDPLAIVAVATMTALPAAATFTAPAPPIKSAARSPPKQGRSALHPISRPSRLT